MAGLTLDLFERQAEAFARARVWREWAFLTGLRPGRGLRTLYEEDFPDFTSTDLWADLQATPTENPRQLRALSELLAAAHLEGQTAEFAIDVTRIEARSTVTFEDAEMPWREAPAHWPLLADVSRRHELEESWRGVWRSDLNPVLERWQEALRAQLVPLGSDDWLSFWSVVRGIDLDQLTRHAETLLRTTEDIYAPGLGVYFGQFELPLDDAWQSDADRAFRATRFDTFFPEQTRMPVMIRAMRDLGIELQEQTQVHLDSWTLPELQCIALDVPNEVRVVERLTGGWEDYARTLRGLGEAEHRANTDASLAFWERWLGDSTPTLGYGLLLEGLVRDKMWLAAHLDYTASDDFRVISHLAWLYRIRGIAATVHYERRLWQAEPGGSMASAFADDTLTPATRVRHFPDEYLKVMPGAPWSTFRSATHLRAELFAGQLRAFLRREFDEEWWRSSRAAHFICDELWRPGRRNTAEELLGFMGYEGFDSALLAAEFEEVLRPL